MSPPPSGPESPAWRRRLAWLLALLVVVGGVYLLLDATLLASDEDGGDGAPPTAVQQEDGSESEVSPESEPEPESESSPPPEGPGPDDQEVTLSRFTVESEAVGQALPVSVLEPSGETPGPRPLLVFLHGAGGTDQSSASDPAVVETLARLGPRAPLVAFPDGQMSWWRDRADGDWGHYVVREVVPAVAHRFETDPRRVAVGGISMGGFGAYHLGLRFPQRFCAVGGHSAGLYLDFDEASFGAFDSPADFRRNNIISTVRSDPNAFGAARIWNDYGDEDWFVAGNSVFVNALQHGDADLTAHVWPGGHDNLYWSEHWPDYLRFYSRSLANCKR